eukprot:2309014-Heterocapsa_arctica.AAC.1
MAVCQIVGQWISDGRAQWHAMGFRAHGRPKLCENTSQDTTSGAGGPSGAAGGGAVVVFVVRFRVALAGHVLEGPYG